MFGFSAHESSARRAKSMLAAADLIAPDRLLEREHESGADRLDDRRRAALLADLRVGMVRVPARRDERDGATAGNRGDAVAEQRSAWPRARPACQARR